MAGKRLSREARRAQLLDMAAQIVRQDGTEGLTLAALAERAGVTKPIAYEHFGTRDGLLMALYRRLDADRAAVVAAALARSGDTLERASAILAAAYVDCVRDAGAAFAQVAAALSANADMDAFHREQRALYVEQYRRAFSAFTPLTGKSGQALVEGLLGSADVLAREAAAGRMTRSVAIDSLKRIMLGALTCADRSGGAA